MVGWTDGSVGREGQDGREGRDGRDGRVGLIGRAGLTRRDSRDSRDGRVGRVGLDRSAGPLGLRFAQLGGMPQGHEKLVAWQRADDLFVAIHGFAATLPIEERYGLTSQMRRAAYSVPANIVEGMARRSIRDRLRFLNIAEASLAEVA